MHHSAILPENRLLAFLGPGGAHSLIELVVLKRIQEKLGNIPFIDHVDATSGVSAGGIIAGGLASGHSVEEMNEIFNKYLPIIFRQLNHTLNTIRSKFLKAGNPERSKLIHQDIDILRNCVQELVGDIKIKDLSHSISLSAWDHTDREDEKVVRFVHDTRTPSLSLHDETSLVDAIVAGCCAPVLYPDFKILLNGQERALVDGGYFEHPLHLCISQLAELGGTQFQCIAFRAGRNPRPYDTTDYKQILPGTMNTLTESPIAYTYPRATIKACNDALRALIGEENFINFDIDMGQVIPEKLWPEISPDKATPEWMEWYRKIGETICEQQAEDIDRACQMLTVNYERKRELQRMAANNAQSIFPVTATAEGATAASSSFGRAVKGLTGALDTGTRFLQSLGARRIGNPEAGRQAEGGPLDTGDALTLQ